MATVLVRKPLKVVVVESLEMHNYMHRQKRKRVTQWRLKEERKSM